MRYGIQKRNILVIFLCMMLGLVSLSACKDSNEKQLKSKQDDEPITVYLWETTLFDEFVSYVKQQCPDINIEFVAGNNNIYLYDYLKEHGELPDIITTRRFSAIDAKNLSPQLMDLGAYDVVSSFYSYILQYYKNTNGEIQWLPVCGIPETMIVNKTLFDGYGIKIPENYDEFVNACTRLKQLGIKPYAYDLSMDYAAHTLVQSSALDKFTSLDGIVWRSEVESSDGEISFDEEMWMKIFDEVNNFIADAGLNASDLEKDSSDAIDMFVNKEAAMFRGTPSVMEELKEMSDDEFVRIPYFSQSSNESWLYTYPSLNISLNKDLEEDNEKLSKAMRILECFLSQKGQEYISGGEGMISYNVGIDSDISGMEGVQDEIERNSVYIRYASNNSFSASQELIDDLLLEDKSKEETFEAFKNKINTKATTGDSAVEFEKTYSLSLNENNGRDAASVVLSTVREAIDADLSLTTYFSYSSSIYEGKCSKRELSMICNNNKGTPLYLTLLKGSEVYALVEAYLQDTGTSLQVTNKYELPVASGMKLILIEKENGYQLKDIEVNGEPIKDETEYKMLLSGYLQDVFNRVFVDGQKMESLGMALSGAWQSAIYDGQKIAEPEDYILIENNE